MTGVAVWSLATFVCVPAFRWAPDAPWPLVVCRVVIGFAEGCNYPSQVRHTPTVSVGSGTRTFYHKMNNCSMFSPNN